MNLREARFVDDPNPDKVPSCLLRAASHLAESMPGRWPNIGRQPPPLPTARPVELISNTPPRSAVKWNIICSSAGSELGPGKARHRHQHRQWPPAEPPACRQTFRRPMDPLLNAVGATWYPAPRLLIIPLMWVHRLRRATIKTWATSKPSYRPVRRRLLISMATTDWLDLAENKYERAMLWNKSGSSWSILHGSSICNNFHVNVMFYSFSHYVVNWAPVDSNVVNRTLMQSKPKFRWGCLSWVGYFKIRCQFVQRLY